MEKANTYLRQRALQRFPVPSGQDVGHLVRGVGPFRKLLYGPRFVGFHDARFFAPRKRRGCVAAAARVHGFQHRPDAGEEVLVHHREGRPFGNRRRGADGRSGMMTPSRPMRA